MYNRHRNFVNPLCAERDYSPFTEKSHMHQLLPEFQLLIEHQNKSLLRFYWSVICLKLNETKVLNILYLKYISNTWFQLKIHKNYILSVLGT